MKILVVGGSIFLGRHLVEAALAQGHQLTTFSRGRHDIPKHRHPVEKLRGDRHGDVSTLDGREWDAVIDTCGYLPGGVRHLMNGIDRSRVGHYTFVSSVSVYPEYPLTGLDETAPVATITSEKLQEAESIATGARATARTYGPLYGALKARCEPAAEDAMPGRVLNVRPGLIVGPYDYSDRFTYWVRRVAEGGDVLAPGMPARRVRVIDARDLAEWIVRMAESGQPGVFNATGAEDGLSMGGMLETCLAVSGSDARMIWTDEKILLDRGVEPWGELPLWIPAADNGIFEARSDKAVAAGLTFRPLDATIADTLDWDRTRPQNEPLHAGLTRERERLLLTHATHPPH